jgi:hypothetical protein
MAGLPGPVPIVPIGDVEELLRAASIVLETEEPPEEIERVLDGISRLCHGKPKRFEALAGPLAARAARLPGAVLTPAILAWTGSVKPGPRPTCSGLISFLWARVHEVSVRAWRGNAAPLTGVPSHSGIVLDPVRFVERLRANRDPGLLDLIQGLLRLWPGNRREALAESAMLGGDIGRAVRYALGGDSEGDSPRPAGDALWAAAALARSPRIDFGSSLEPERRIDRPGELTANPGTQDPAMLRWCATVWPWNREGFYAAGTQAIAMNLAWPVAALGNRVYLETLAASTAPLGPKAYELLALGLASRWSEEATAASEALLSGLSTGRIEAGTLGDTFARLAARGGIAVSRWTRRLATVARRRREYSREIALVQSRLAGAPLPGDSGDMSGLLELLLELRTQSEAVTESTAGLAKGRAVSAGAGPDGR